MKNSIKKEVVKEEKLTKKQLEILRLAYRFRFLTSSNLAAYVGQSKTSTALRRLMTLVNLEYLGKRHDSSYRLLNRPAEYYLLPKAKSILREELTRASERELKRLYDRPTASLRFINRSLAVFDSYIELRRLYDQRMTVATQSQLNIDEFSYFPHPLPDAFMTLDGSTNHESHYFIEYFDDSVSIGIHGRRISAYMAYFESGEWDKTGLDFPGVIIICESAGMLSKAKRRVRYLTRNDPDNITFIVIDLLTLKTIQNTIDQN
jgi:hypothetical protein